MKTLINYLLGYCYVIIANDSEKVKECLVFYNHKKALKVRANMISIYGATNVCFASRVIGRKSSLKS